MIDAVVTGVGVVSTLGHSAGEMLDAMLEGRSALVELQGFPEAPFGCPRVATVSGFKAKDWVANRKNLKLMSAATRFGIAAVKLAYAAARLEGVVDPQRLGLFVGAGTALGDSKDLQPAIDRAVADGAFDSQVFGSEGMHLINPLWLLKGLSNNVLGFASADLDARGVNQNYCNSPPGGLQAIGEAAWALTEGKADALIAGGADSGVDAAHLTGFGRLEMLSPSGQVRPFGVGHDGFAPGEGAAFVALERAEHAAPRGARPLARIVGYGNAGGANALTTGLPETIAASFRAALRRARWNPSDVDLVIAHGSATPAFDPKEAQAIRVVFGDRTPPVTANKGLLGHAIAASGVLSVAAAVEILQRGVVPAAGRYRKARSCRGLDLVLSDPRALPDLRRVLVHAAGLGGQTTVLAIEKVKA